MCAVPLRHTRTSPRREMPMDLFSLDKNPFVSAGLFYDRRRADGLLRRIPGLHDLLSGFIVKMEIQDEDKPTNGCKFSADKLRTTLSISSSPRNRTQSRVTTILTIKPAPGGGLFRAGGRHVLLLVCQPCHALRARRENAASGVCQRRQLRRQAPAATRSFTRASSVATRASLVN